MNKKILLIELAGIGDIVMSTPAISNLRTSFPDSKIYYLALPRTAELLERSRDIDQVFILRKGLKDFLNSVRLIIQLRNLKIDYAINLYQHYSFFGVINMFLLLKLISPKKTFGRNTDGKGFFYDIKLEDALNSKRHDVESKLALIQKLDCKVEDKNLKLLLNDADVEKVNQFLEGKGVLDLDLLIGINPGGYRPSRRWSLEKFAEVGKLLAKKHQAKIVITGSKLETNLAKKISNQMSIEPIDSTGILSLTQLTALIKRCNLYISNDSGPMHIANALKTPLVAIIGPGMPKIYPYQKDNTIIIKHEAECSPCYKHKCAKKKCLEMISIDEVIQAAETLLEANVKT